MIRLGIIGCGNMCSQHLQSIQKLKDVLKISVVCDLSEQRAKRAQNILSAEKYELDYHNILSDVDAVLIALPHKLHYEVGKFFIENGKHVLMEKPLCRKEKECLELTALAEKHSVVLMTAYPVRYWDSTIKMKEYMESGIIGEVFQMTVYTDHYNPARDTRGTWMNCAGLGGGQTFSHGCHYIDMLLLFLGNPVSGTHIGTNKGTPWMDREGTSHTIIKFENGTIGYHTGTWGARGTTSRYKVEIFGTEGTLSFSTEGKNANEIVLIKNIGFEESTTNVLWKNDATGKNTSGEIEHFIDCVINDKTPITDGYISTTGLRVIWKLYDAEKENRIADLSDLGFDKPFINETICDFDCDSEEAIADYKN